MCHELSLVKVRRFSFLRHRSPVILMALMIGGLNELLMPDPMLINSRRIFIQYRFWYHLAGTAVPAKWYWRTR